MYLKTKCSSCDCVSYMVHDDTELHVSNCQQCYLGLKKGSLWENYSRCYLKARKRLLNWHTRMHFNNISCLPDLFQSMKSYMKTMYFNQYVPSLNFQTCHFTYWGGSNVAVGIALLNMCFSLSLSQFQPIFVSFASFSAVLCHCFKAMSLVRIILS